MSDAVTLIEQPGITLVEPAAISVAPTGDVTLVDGKAAVSLIEVPSVSLVQTNTNPSILLLPSGDVSLVTVVQVPGWQGAPGVGAPDASTTVKGITKLSVAPVSPTNPIAFGANDPAVELTANKDTDGALTANSDTKYASQKATKTYADTKEVANAAIVKTNVAAQISGVAGKSTPVDADVALIEDSAAANAKKSLTWANIKATLKTYFDAIYQAALGYTPEDVANKDTSGTLAANSDTKYPSQKAVKTYAVTGPTSVTDSDFVQYNGVGGRSIKDGGLSLDLDGALTANSDAKVPSQKAVKTYVDGRTLPAPMITADIAKSANFTVVVGDKAKVFQVTTAASTITATLPAAATAGDGWYIFLRKADAGAGTIATSPAESPGGTLAAMRTGDMAVVWSDSTAYFAALYIASIPTGGGGGSSAPAIEVPFY